MIEGNQFVATVRDYFSFLEHEFGFIALQPKILGNAFYEVRYKRAENLISVSYENIEDYLLVIVFRLARGKLPDYDDKTRTLHLNYLTAAVFKKVDSSEIKSNRNEFVQFKPDNPLARRLLKSATELRLCLRNLDCLLN